MSRFQDKVVIVTGSSSGIGAATALLFAKEGAKLTVTGRSEKGVKQPYAFEQSFAFEQTFSKPASYDADGPCMVRRDAHLRKRDQLDGGSYVRKRGDLRRPQQWQRWELKLNYP
ncbi:hypothetical protein ANCCEY_14652 [Ancylostoma ceylanicum]|uniref:Oxidoreductase, short chain dehydrogenase/reductase family protein n=1 Tax=Ancylostoma ceylanicum TaxID=53326 RepID=A0A0D6L4Q6_9BILA|nr:hypothetical protein ANCCEY_14652 [Ancylostoma ceylanicum]